MAAKGRFAPDDTVVAIITGNGLKTLDDHPEKPWPAKIECELDAMITALDELKGGDSPVTTARAQLGG
jgi:threonine synthase